MDIAGFENEKAGRIATLFIAKLWMFSGRDGFK